MLKLFLHLFDIVDTAFSYEKTINSRLIAAVFLQRKKEVACNLQLQCTYCVFLLRPELLTILHFVPFRNVTLET